MSRAICGPPHQLYSNAQAIAMDRVWMPARETTPVSFELGSSGWSGNHISSASVGRLLPPTNRNHLLPCSLLYLVRRHPALTLIYQSFSIHTRKPNVTKRRWSPPPWAELGGK